MFAQKYIKYKDKYLQAKHSMSTEQLHVKDPWLYYIQIGQKTVEGRRGTYDKFKKWIGNKVYFYNDERKIPVKVIDVHHYKDLYEYLN